LFVYYGFSIVRALLLTVQKMYSPEPVIENYLHDDLTWSMIHFSCMNLESLVDGTRQKVQIDVWVPKLKLGFEYHGTSFFLAGLIAIILTLRRASLLYDEQSVWTCL
jgi:hypothetical protein